MPEINLQDDIDDARNEIEPHVLRLQGLLQMWHMFLSAVVVSQEFHSKFDDLSYQLKIACTRSFVVDYLKSWSGNYSPEINSLKVQASNNKWSYPFLESIVQTDEHEQLIELRNSTVAHLDREYEGGGLSLKGMRVQNTPVGGKQEGTLDEVFLPAVAVIAGIRGLWWLSSKEKLAELCNHVEQSKRLVEIEIRETAMHFREACIDHMHVLSQLQDLFGVVDIPLVAGTANVTRHAEDPKPLSISNPIVLKIGDQNIQSLVTVYEPRPDYPTGIDIKGKGYWLKIGEASESGQLDFNISFPKYPYPKEPV